MNILEKSAAELKLNDLNNDEINALAAKWCEGRRIRHRGSGANQFYQGYTELYISKIPYWGEKIIPSYTTDMRDAGRLLVKYQIQIRWLDNEYLFVNLDTNSAKATHIDPGISPEDLERITCRAITEAALAKAMEKRSSRDDIKVKVIKLSPEKMQAAVDRATENAKTQIIWKDK